MKSEIKDEKLLPSYLSRLNLKQAKLNLPQVQEWETTYLNAQKNSEPTIIKAISHIRFTKLTFVDLCYNDIQSIEMLYTLKMPEIQKIWLYKNNIISLKGVLKANWRKLSNLDLSANHISDWKELLHLKMETFDCITIDSSGTLHSQDVRWISKLQCRTIEKVSIHNKARIHQKGLNQKLKKKYGNLELRLDSTDI